MITHSLETTQTPPILAETDYADRTLNWLKQMPPEVQQTPGWLDPVITRLVQAQMDGWQDMRENFEGLQSLKKTEVPLCKSRIVVQLNEKRGNRVKQFCFLDAGDLPEQQRGLAFDNLFVTPNPYAILPDHLTGIYPAHHDQSIDKMLRPALHLARALGGAFAVFYNGPLAGASAPNHAHIQAVRVSTLPIETSLQQVDRSGPGFDRKGGKSILYMPQSVGRTILAIESPDTVVAEATVRQIIEKLPREPGDLPEYDEPRMNVLLRAQTDGTMHTLIAPRASREVQLANNHKLLPATLEAMGIVVVSNPEDFTHLQGNEAEVAHIFREASRDPEEVEARLEDMPHALAA